MQPNKKKEVQDGRRWLCTTQERQLCEEKLVRHPEADGGVLGWPCCCSGADEFRMRVVAALGCCSGEVWRWKWRCQGKEVCSEGSACRGL